MSITSIVSISSRHHRLNVSTGIVLGLCRSSIISYTEAEETISLVIEREAFEALSARAVDGDRSILNVYNHLWAVLRVGDGTPLGYGTPTYLSAPPSRCRVVADA